MSSSGRGDFLRKSYCSSVYSLNDLVAGSGFHGSNLGIVFAIRRYAGAALFASDFERVCRDLGQSERLLALDVLVRSHPAGPSLDARIALEIGWLQPFSMSVGLGELVTGVTTSDFHEDYPLHAPWYRYAPRDWWNDGAAICNRVPNIPQYSTDPGSAMQVLPCIDSAISFSLVVHRENSWIVHVIDSGRQRILATCRPGAETMAKAIVLAGIDYRLRAWRKRGRTMPLRNRNEVIAGEADE